MDMTRLAQPGDPDLDFDVSGLTITSLTVMDRDIMLSFTGGVGWFLNDDDGQRTPDMTDVAADVIISVTSAPPDIWDVYVNYIDRWATDKTLLRMCAAPDRMTTLIASPSEWLPLPRTPFPAPDINGPA